jgi:siroheme synthase-like protein
MPEATSNKEKLMSPTVKETNNLFPVFIKLEQMRLLIVGGGYIGLEKLNTVLHNSPSTTITLVAIEISLEIRQLAADRKNLILHQRAFEVADVDDADIVIVAINDAMISAEISKLAKSKGKLVNAADKPDLCDFYLGSVVKKGNLKIAISTNGKSPTAAKRIKEVLNNALPEELDQLIDNLHDIRNSLKGDFTEKVKKLNAITKDLVETETTDKRNWRKIATYSISIFALMLIGHFIFSYVPLKGIAHTSVEWYKTLDPNFHWMILAGFLAQLVDGALGMGYGVTSATILLSSGVNLASISSSIHTAEMFASGASGYSHYKFGNVNKKLFKILVIPGVLGAIIGAILLAKFGNTHAQYLRPVMAVYTLFLGVRIFANAFWERKNKSKFKRHGLLAGVGGFLDSFAGGGWGPIVTTTLITRGRSPRFVIGSVSLTEFFVTLSSALTFFTLLGVTHWQVIVALIIGSLTAAPLAARLAGKLPRKASFILLGLLVIIWSIRILL